MSKFSHMILEHIERLKAFDMINVRRCFTLEPETKYVLKGLYMLY